jgi:Na+-translocating ferredoxin:NAD+ oxidoreductase RnfC subunit
MMGKLVTDLSQPVTKTTGGLLVFPADHILIARRTTPMEQVLKVAETNCVQCNLCTELCPRHMIGHELPPHLLVRSSNFRDMGMPLVRLSALTCSECGVCEAYACPVDISPMRINIALKATLRAQGQRYEGGLRPVDPLAEHRFLPSRRLIDRIRIARFVLDAPLVEDEWRPTTVNLPLRQHIGAPATAVVKVGDRVARGQTIARMEGNALGADIHASIDGRVGVVTAQAITLHA